MSPRNTKKKIEDATALPQSTLASFVLHSSLILLALPTIKEGVADAAPLSTTEQYEISLDRDETFISHSDVERSHGSVPGHAVAPAQRAAAATPSSSTNARPTGGTLASRGNGGPAAQASGGTHPGAASYPASGPSPEGPSGIVSEWEMAPARSDNFVPSGGGGVEHVGGVPGPPRSGAAKPSTGLAPSGDRPGVPQGIPDGAGSAIKPGVPGGPNRGRDIGGEIPGSIGPNVGETDRGGSPPRPVVSTTPRFGTRRIIFQPQLHYPEWAERDRVQSTPVFDIVVSPDGRVSSAHIAVSSGYPDLDRLAEENVRRWIYEKRDGQAEPRRANVQFKLNMEL